MKVEKKFVIELIGTLSIAASLLFVGFQLSLDRKVALGTQFGARIASVRERFISQFENDVWIRQVVNGWEQTGKPSWWNDDVQNFQRRINATDEEMYRLYLQEIIILAEFDNNHYQYQLGLIEDEDWMPIRESRKTSLQNSAIARALAPVGARPQSKLLLSELLSELDFRNQN